MSAKNRMRARQFASHLEGAMWAEGGGNSWGSNLMDSDANCDFSFMFLILFTGRYKMYMSIDIDTECHMTPESTV